MNKQSKIIQKNEEISKEFNNGLKILSNLLLLMLFQHQLSLHFNLIQQLLHMQLPSSLFFIHLVFLRGVRGAAADERKADHLRLDVHYQYRRLVRGQCAV